MFEYKLIFLCVFRIHCPTKVKFNLAISIYALTGGYKIRLNGTYVTSSIEK